MDIIFAKMFFEPLASIIAITAMILPFAIIPLVFKASAGVLGSITGMASDKTKGFKANQQKKREAKRADWKGGNAFKGGPDGGLRSRLNSGISTGMHARDAGLRPSNMRAGIDAAKRNARSAESGSLLENDNDVKSVAVDDALARAAQLGTNRQSIKDSLLSAENESGEKRFSESRPRELAKAVAMVERAQKAGSTGAVRGAMAIARANSGTGYKDAVEMQESIIQASGGDRTLEGNLLAAARAGSERANRPDLANPGHPFQQESMEALRAVQGRPAGDPERERVRDVQRRKNRQAAFAAKGVHSIISGRTPAATQLVTQVGQDFQAAMRSGDTEGAVEAASQLKSLRDASGNASPEVRAAITSTLVAAGIDTQALNPATGQAYSTDDQLGVIIGGYGASHEVTQALTQDIRTRAGSYDVGGGGLDTAQIAAQRGQPGGP